jgi:hypothetical protein
MRALFKRMLAPLLCCAAFIGSASAHDFTDAFKAVLEQAKKEGKVRILSPALSYPDSQVKVLEAAFEAYFGFPMDIDIVGLGTQPVAVQRIRTEFQAGVELPVDLIPLTVAAI